MPSVTISELKNSEQIKAWIEAGEVIDLRESDRVVAKIVPQTKPEDKEVLSPTDKWPDFEARHRMLFGDQVFNAVEDFLQDRHGRY